MEEEILKADQKYCPHCRKIKSISEFTGKKRKAGYCGKCMVKVQTIRNQELKRPEPEPGLQKSKSYR